MFSDGAFLRLGEDFSTLLLCKKAGVGRGLLSNESFWDTSRSNAEASPSTIFDAVALASISSAVSWFLSDRSD